MTNYKSWRREVIKELEELDNFVASFPDRPSAGEYSSKAYNLHTLMESRQWTHDLTRRQEKDIEGLRARLQSIERKYEQKRQAA